MDTRTAEQRRQIMQAVKSRDTGPEMVVRRLLHSLGYRYRVHRKDLPGKPDVAFLSRRKEEELRSMGWDVLTIWECETADLEALAGRLHGFLGRRSVGRTAGAGRGSPAAGVSVQSGSRP